MDKDTADKLNQINEAYQKEKKETGFNRYDRGSIPILKEAEKERILKFGLVMFYGQFGWCIGDQPGFGTAQFVIAQQVDLEAMEKAKEKK